MNKQTKDTIEEIKTEIIKHKDFILSHLESDSDDFSGYFMKEHINEDSFHIPFDNVIRKIEKLNDLVEQVEREARERNKLLELIAYYSMVVMTELHQDGEGIVGHLIDSDDNPGQMLRNLLVKANIKLKDTRYGFLLEGEQFDEDGYTSADELLESF